MSAQSVVTPDLVGKVTACNERSVIFVYELLQGEARVSLGILTFVPSKHLTLSDPGLMVEVQEAGDGFDVTVSARSLARFVQLSLEGCDEAAGVFSDNYFDIPAGRAVPVTLPAMVGWDVARVRAALRVRSLIDSY